MDLLKFVLAILAAVLVQIPVAAITVVLPMLLAGASIAEVSSGFLFYMYFVSTISLTALTLIGIPAHLWLYKHGLATSKNLVKVGVAAAVLIQIVLFFPVDWSGGLYYVAYFLGKTRELVVDGMPTVWGWLSFLKDAAIFSAHGASAALVYGLVWASLYFDKPPAIDRVS